MFDDDNPLGVPDTLTLKDRDWLVAHLRDGATIMQGITDEFEKAAGLLEAGDDREATLVLAHTQEYIDKIDKGMQKILLFLGLEFLKGSRAYAILEGMPDTLPEGWVPRG